jgi:hypothetical protein
MIRRCTDSNVVSIVPSPKLSGSWLCTWYLQAAAVSWHGKLVDESIDSAIVRFNENDVKRAGFTRA